MTEIDLAVAWEWSLDHEFVGRLLSGAHRRGWTSLQITHANLEPVMRELAAGNLRFRSFLDRASDVWPEFAPLTALAEQHDALIINHIHHQNGAADKARDHLLCATQGIPTPLTIIVPPLVEDPAPPRLPAALGRPFVAKPASGGGGTGVLLEVRDERDVQNARAMFPHDHYLLQRRVRPQVVAGRRAWFRVFHVAGQTVPCWWDDLSHVYAPLDPADEIRLGLGDLRRLATRIGEITALDFFTTEIALGCDGRLVCVDYANSPCDMRLQSQHVDGVPDAVVDRVVEHLLEAVDPRREEAAVRVGEEGGRASG